MGWSNQRHHCAWGEIKTTESPEGNCVSWTGRSEDQMRTSNEQHLGLLLERLEEWYQQDRHTMGRRHNIPPSRSQSRHPHR
jgi:hypothetical protein